MRGAKTGDISILDTEQRSGLAKSTPPKPTQEPTTDTQNSANPLPRYGGKIPVKSIAVLSSKNSVRTSEMNVAKTRMKKVTCNGTVVSMRCNNISMVAAPSRDD